MNKKNDLNTINSIILGLIIGITIVTLIIASTIGYIESEEKDEYCENKGYDTYSPTKQKCCKTVKHSSNVGYTTTCSGEIKWD